jgi:hypothetical protein
VKFTVEHLGHKLHRGAGVAIQHGSQRSREVRSVGSSARKLCRLANMSEGAPIRRAGSGLCIGTLRSLVCAVTDRENRCGDGEHQKCQRTEREGDGSTPRFTAAARAPQSRAMPRVDLRVPGNRGVQHLNAVLLTASSDGVSGVVCESGFRCRAWSFGGGLTQAVRVLNGPGFLQSRGALRRSGLE